METFKLDEKDRKIIIELQKNSKASFSYIGKKVRLPKNVVAYRVKRLTDSGFLNLFCMVVSKTKLNYISSRLFLKLHNFNKEIESQLINFLKSKKGMYWIANLNGCYDLGIIFLSKDISEMNNTYSKIIFKFSKYIHSKDLSISVDSYYFPLRYVFETKDKIIKSFYKPKQYKIDQIDLDIINLTKQNSRTPLLEISEKLKLSQQTIRSRIKNLESSRIIGAYRIRINHKMLGFHHFHTFLNLSNISEKKEKEIVEFVSQLDSTIHIIKGTGKYDLEFESLLKDHFQLFEIISKIKNKFPENILNSDSCLIYKIYDINTVKYEL